MNDYRSKECCEKFSNLNDTFKHYQDERKAIIEELQKDPVNLTNKLWTNYLSNDKYCMRNSGHGQAYDSNSCIPCFNLSIMVDHDVVDAKKSFQVLGFNMIVIKTEVGTPGCEISEKDKTMALNFLKKNQILLSCGSQPVDELTFLRCDTFTNNMLVWWIVDDIFTNKNLPSLTLHTGYICKDSGFLLTDYPIIGSYDKLIEHQRNKGVPIENTVERIIQQLKTKLQVLSQYYFSHGNPDLKRITFGYHNSETENDIIQSQEMETSYSYEEEMVTNTQDYTNSEDKDFELFIIDYTYSSITIGNTRIYPKSVRANMFLQNGSMNIDIRDGMYRISDDKSVLFYYIRHAGLPFYSTSFDYYNFMICLMQKKNFRDAVYKTPHLNQQWEDLWESVDIAKINDMISKDKPVSEIMSDVWLRCNPFS